jgi:hypothetical protein
MTYLPGASRLPRALLPRSNLPFRLSLRPREGRSLQARGAVQDAAFATSAILACGGIALSSLNLLHKVAQLPDGDMNETDTDLVWTIASTVSFIPVFNWLVRNPFFLELHDSNIGIESCQ